MTKAKSQLEYEGHGIWFVKGYACVEIDGKGYKVHVLVWESVNGSKPKGYDIHHRDENKANYCITNLELLTYSDHQRTHAGWLKDQRGEWCSKPCSKCGIVLPLSQFYVRRTANTPSALCKQCSRIHFREQNIARGGKPKRYILPNASNEYQCSKCAEWKPPENFPKTIKSYCKKCINAAQNERRREASLIK